ncbi:DASS family sodium-coupled anion symporter [Aerococcaceae bacterium zg-BR9]|uniref:SLC13 family permease n=1 Tax=Aerococcaceae bacterium zg-1292 TaxID=2774330 RepID=UPI0040629265|nr:DASS family sodium-coupled anion symporter [Aerococcaceae bacterium zg-BR9]MBF6977866.1 DASS family sodium-coupled anion symporter [Aerococcaceae bacterium zg-BR22]
MSKDIKSNYSPLIGICLSIISFLILFFMPLPNGMTTEGQKSLAIFVSALILWVTKPIPIYQTSIIAILLLPLIGAVENQKVAFGTLGFDIIWLMVAAFVLTSAMSETNLGKRLALTLVTKFGKSKVRTLAVFVIVNFLLAFFVPSTTARASLIVPIALVLLEVYQAVPGQSKYGKLMMLQGVQNNAFATSMVMTATSAQVIAVGFINEQAGGHIGYMDWLIGSIPQAFLTAIFMFLIGLKIFHIAEKNGDDANAIIQEKLKLQLNTLGKLSSAEKRVGIIFLITLFLWATGDFQEAWFGFEISTEQTAVLSMLLCLLPKVGVLTWKQAKIKWDLMLFSAGAYAVGNAFNDSGGASWLIEHLVDAIGLDKLNHGLVAIILIFITVFSHLLFTSKTVRTTILIPAIITIATTLGMDPVSLALACSFGIASTITLPPHSKVNTLYFGTGYFSVLDELKFGLIGCFVNASVISVVYFTWLQIILH